MMESKNKNTPVVDPAEDQEKKDPAVDAKERLEPQDSVPVDLREKYQKKHDKQWRSTSEARGEKAREKAALENKIISEDQEKCSELLQEWRKKSKKEIENLDKKSEELTIEINKEVDSRNDYPARYYKAQSKVEEAKAALQKAQVELNEVQSENSNSQSRETEKRNEKVRIGNEIRDLIDEVRRGPAQIFGPLPVDVLCPIHSCRASLPSKYLYPHRTNKIGKTVEIGKYMYIECQGPVCRIHRNVIQIDRVSGGAKNIIDEAVLIFFG